MPRKTWAVTVTREHWDKAIQFRDVDGWSTSQCCPVALAIIDAVAELGAGVSVGIPIPERMADKPKPCYVLNHISQNPIFAHYFLPAIACEVAQAFDDTGINHWGCEFDMERLPITFEVEGWAP